MKSSRVGRVRIHVVDTCLLLILTLSAATAQNGPPVTWGNDIGGVRVKTPSTGSYDRVAAGATYSIARKSDGTLVSWPINDAPAGTFASFAAGDGHRVGVRSDGTLASWGSDGFGQVANTPAGSYTAADAGQYHSVALRADGTLVTWGGDQYDGPALRNNTPTGSFIAVAAGKNHCSAVRSNGTIVSWGNAQLFVVNYVPPGDYTAVTAGDGFSVGLRSDGTLVAWGTNNLNYDGPYRSVDAGGNHWIAIRTDGTIDTFGSNSHGQNVFPPYGIFLSAAAGRTHNVAVRSDGKIISWGNDPDNIVNRTPVFDTLSVVACGMWHAVGVRSNGSLVAWGFDEQGQVRYTPSTGTYRSVSAGRQHNVALRTDGALVSWGHDFYGQVANTPAGSYLAIAAGGDHTVAVRSDGALRAWGYDGFRQVRDTPNGNYQAVAAGEYHNVAIRTNGTLVSWGNNGSGQVANTPSGTFVAVAAGRSHSLAIRTNGTLISWGSNAGGLVSNTPTGGPFIAIAAGSLMSAAVKSDGTLICWGDDANMQLTDRPEGNFSAVACGDRHCLAIDVTPQVYSLQVEPDPAVVVVGQPFNIHWQAPPRRPYLDWIGLFKVGGNDADWRQYWYTRGDRSGFATFVENEPGEYECRYYLNGSFTRVASTPKITVTPDRVSLTASPTSGTASVTAFSVDWTAPAGQDPTDWIGLYRVGDPNRSYLWWRYTNGATSGRFTVGTLGQGDYEFRYLLRNGYESIAISNRITVSAPPFSVTGSPSTAIPGGALSVSWTAPPGRPSTDWVALYRVGDPSSAYGWWRYTGGAESGTINLTAPVVAGDYEFRYLLDNGYLSVAASGVIRVSSSGFSLTASPSTVSAGGALSVSWTAPAGRPGTDWIGLYRVGDSNRSYGWWRYTNGAQAGTLDLNAPLTPGQYEFRYLLDNGYNSVVTSNSVTVQ